MITNVKGEFRRFSAEAVSEGNDFSSAEVNLTIDAASVFTNNDDRDNHLKSADFLMWKIIKSLLLRRLKLKKWMMVNTN
jgi:polyisoprenoid-binding protein YceI